MSTNKNLLLCIAVPSREIIFKLSYLVTTYFFLFIIYNHSSILAFSLLFFPNMFGMLIQITSVYIIQLLHEDCLLQLHK